MKKLTYQRGRTQLSTRRKQRGILLVDVMLGVILFIFLLTAFARYQNHQYLVTQAEMAKTRVNYIIDKAKSYYMARIVVDGNDPADSANFPSSYDDLTDAGYINECSSSDESSNLCVDYSNLPIGEGEVINFTVSSDSDGYPVLDLDFDLGQETNQSKKNLLLENLSGVAGFSMDSDDNVTISVTRPGSAATYENFVKRDGSTAMTGDWDYGSSATLENVVDITFEGITDRTAITSLFKNGSTYIDSSSGYSVSKPDCPSGYSPTITTYFIGTGGSTEYTEVSNIDTWFESNSSTWDIFVRFAAYDSSTGGRSWVYQGNVGYFTWCDL